MTIARANARACAAMAINFGQSPFYLYDYESMFMNLVNRHRREANLDAQVGVNQSQERQSLFYVYHNESPFVKSQQWHALRLLHVPPIS